MRNPMLLIASAYHDDPDAREFAEFLADRLPDWAADWAAEMDYGAWETDIPPRAQWQAEADSLIDHLERRFGVTLGEYAARRAEAGVVVFYCSVGTPMGRETVLGHQDIDDADACDLTSLPGKVDDKGNWQWDGDGHRTDYSDGSQILNVKAYVDGERWQEIVDEYNEEIL